MIDREKVKELRLDLDRAFEIVGSKYDVKIRTVSIIYTGQTATATVEILSKGENGEIVTKEAEAFKLRATNYGFKPSDLGAKLLGAANQSFTLIGLKPGARKYPILARRDSDGAVYKISAPVALGILKRAQDRAALEPPEKYIPQTAGAGTW